MNKIANLLYPKLPVFMQNIACTIYGYLEKRKRFNLIFHNYMEIFSSSQYLDKNDIQKYQKKMLTLALDNAYKLGLLKNISFKDINKDPFAVLNKVPILEKDDIRGLVKKINNNKDSNEVITSGTTGKALKFYKDKNSIAAQWAIWQRHRKRFGIQLGDLSVNFTGKPVVPNPKKGRPHWRYNAAISQYLIGMKSISRDNIKDIVIFLNSIEPKFWSGYPSLIAEVARLALSEKLVLNNKSKPSVIFTGAENLLDYQIADIKKWINVKISDQYGLSEGCCNFSHCEEGNYHEDFEFGYFELLNPITLEDGAIKGELIATSFYNYDTPFIRYNTGDVVIVEPDDFKCKCGRSSKVIRSIEGRIDDYVLTPDGKRIMRFDYIFKNTQEAQEAQVVQHNLSEVEIKAVLHDINMKESFEKKVKENFKVYISKDMEVVFNYVQFIQKSNTGKFKAVVNNLEK